MNYSGIIYDDTANGIGIRTSLFVSGCRNNCPGCFNQEQQNFNYGEPFTEEVEDKIIESVSDDCYSGISILGGDPMEPENAKALLPFIHRFIGTYGETRTIWIYTGYTYEFLNSLPSKDSRKEILIICDVLVDGLFIESKKDIRLKYRGSSNQRIINLCDSYLKEKIILMEDI